MPFFGFLAVLIQTTNLSAFLDVTMPLTLEEMPLDVKWMILDMLDLRSLVKFEQTSNNNKRLVAEVFQRKKRINYEEPLSQEEALKLLFHCDGRKSGPISILPVGPS